MTKLIEFTGQFAVDSNTFGVNFQALVDKQNVPCKVSREALQDVDPSNAEGEAPEQFQLNQASFESIAREKIENGEIINGSVFINSADVS